MAESEDQWQYIGRCLCNCPIYEMDGELKFTCEEYPCEWKAEVSKQLKELMELEATSKASK